jgi:hypothetical protein
LGGRIAIVLGAVLLGALTVAQGMAHIVTSARPTLALTVAPWFARAHGRQTDDLLIAGQTDAANRAAMAALRRDATVIAAVRTAAITGRPEQTARLLALTQRITRRDLPTQLALIERAVQAGDTQQALRHYDEALRSNRRSWPLLLPILAQAAAQPAVAAPLADILAREPQWLYPFYQEWAAKSPEPRAMVLLSQEMQKRGKPLNRDIRVGLLSRLIGAGDWTLLRAELARSMPGCRPDQCIDAGFRRFGILPPVDWSPGAVEKALVVRAPASDDQGHALEYSFNGPGEALLARRLMLLPQGSYGFSHALRPGNTPTMGDVTVTVTCADATGAVLSAARNGGATRQTVARIPAGCPAQWLGLQVASGDSGTVSGRIEQLRVRRHITGTP